MMRAFAVAVAALLAVLTIWLLVDHPDSGRSQQTHDHLTPGSWQDLRRDMLRLHAQISEHDVQAFIRRCRGRGAKPHPRDRLGGDQADDCWISYSLQLTQRLQDLRGRLTPAFEYVADSSACGRALRSYREAVRAVELSSRLPTYRQAAPVLDEARDTLDPFLLREEPASGLQKCSPVL